MFSKISQIFTLKVVSFLVLVLFITSSTNNLLSKETLMSIALAYIGLKLSFYVGIFSIKANNLIVELKPIAYLYVLKTMLFFNGVDLVRQTKTI